MRGDVCVARNPPALEDFARWFSEGIGVLFIGGPDDFAKDQRPVHRHPQPARMLTHGSSKKEMSALVG